MFDHLKPAPCISHTALVFLRLFIAVVMFAVSVTNIVIRGWKALRFFDDWGLYFTCVLFIMMAVAQIKNHRSMDKFNLEVNIDARES